MACYDKFVINNKKFFNKRKFCTEMVGIRSFYFRKYKE